MGDPAAPTSSPIAEPPSAPPTAARTSLAILVILGIAAATRLVMLLDQRAHNPFYYSPILDGAVYWEWAGQIASGEWFDRTPFLSAPLYPYFLGVLRRLGAGHTVVYAIQVLLDLASAYLISTIVRRRFGATAAIVAAAIFLLLTEAAAYEFRVLAATLQIFLACGLWRLLVDWQERRTTGLAVAAGALLGLNCLAGPAFLLVMALIGPWMLLSCRPRRRGVASALAAIVASITVISPATWHNWRVCGEFIPIRVSGVAFAIGNGPGANGTYSSLLGLGLGSSRSTMYEQAARVYQQETGRTRIRWREMDRHFYDKTIAHLRSNVGTACKLYLRKLHWFLTGQYYDDTSPSYHESKSEFARSLQFAPLPAPWVIVPALVGFVGMVRRPRQYFPEWMLVLVPLATVMVSYYTPRYRLPAMPVFAGVAACMLVGAAQRTLAPLALWAVRIALLAGVCIGIVNSGMGFDASKTSEAFWYYTVAVTYGKNGREAETIQYLERAVAANPTVWLFHSTLGESYERAGRLADARRELAAAAELAPNEPQALRSYARHLVLTRELEKALPLLRRTVELWPNDEGSRAWLHQVLMATQRYAEARDNLDEALQRQIAGPQLRGAFVLLLAACPDNSVRDGRRALELARGLSPDGQTPEPWALDSLAAAYAELGQFDEAARLAQQALDAARAAKDEPLTTLMTNRLKLYESGQPLRFGRTATTSPPTTTSAPASNAS